MGISLDKEFPIRMSGKIIITIDLGGNNEAEAQESDFRRNKKSP